MDASTIWTGFELCLGFVGALMALVIGWQFLVGFSTIFSQTLEPDGCVNMSEIPAAPAYLIWHDGSRMTIWARNNLAEAEAELRRGEEFRKAHGFTRERWEVREKLPRRGRVEKFVPLRASPRAS